MNLTCNASNSFQAGHKHRGQFVRLTDERLSLLSVDVPAVDRKTEPKVAFVGFFDGDLEFREKLGLRAASARGPIVCRYAGCASGKLIGNRSGSRSQRHSISNLQALQSKAPGARKKLTHGFCLAFLRTTLNGFLGPVLRSKF